jgi:hypothetical protein
LIFITHLPNYPITQYCLPPFIPTSKGLSENIPSKTYGAQPPSAAGAPVFAKSQQLIADFQLNHQITHLPDGPQALLFRSPDQPITDHPMGAPRSSQDLKDLPETSQARLMERSPGSPERAGFACSGVEAPSAAGFLGSARSQKLVAGLQITQLPNYPFTQWGSSQDLKDLAETSQAVPRPPSLFDTFPLCSFVSFVVNRFCLLQ